MLNKNRLSKSIFRLNKNSKIFTFKENDKNDYDLIFNLSFFSLNSVEKINFFFSNKNNKPGIYEKSSSISNKITFMLDKSRKLDLQQEIKIKSIDYKNFINYNKITLYACNKFNNIIDTYDINLSKNLFDLKKSYIDNINEKKEREKILNKQSYLEYSNNTFKTRINIENKYRVECSIFFNNKVYTSKKTNLSIIEFKREEFNDLYDNIDMYFSDKKNLKLDYSIKYILPGKVETYNQSLDLDIKNYSIKSKKRFSNNLFKNIKITQQIDEDKKTTLRIQSFNDQILKKKISISSINNFNNKKIKLFKVKNNTDKKSEIDNSQLNIENVSFYKENNLDIDNIVLSYNDTELKFFKKDLITLNNSIDQRVYKDTLLENNYYKKLYDFYKTLEQNFKIEAFFDKNITGLINEKMILNIGSFKNDAESFGYNQEENDQNLSDEINFLKSCIFSLEKVYMFNKNIFDVKVVNFKIDDVFDFNNISSNTIESNKSLNLLSSSLKGFLKNRREINPIEKIMTKINSNENADLIYVIDNLSDFEYEVEYNFYVIPVDKTLKLVKNKGFDKQSYLNNNIYVANNPSNLVDIKESNKNLNLFLNQILPSNFSFLKKEKIKKLFLNKENIQDSNNTLCKEIINNTFNIKSQFATKKIDKNIIFKEFSNNILELKSDLKKPAVVFNSLFVSNNKLQKKESKSKFRINRDIIIDLKDTNINNVSDNDQLKIRYIVYSQNENNKNYVNLNKNLFPSYFFDLNTQNYEIYEDVEKNTKYLGININLDELNLNIGNSQYNILIQYTYIKNGLYINNKNTIRL